MLSQDARNLALRVIEATKTHPDAGCVDGQQEWLIDDCGIPADLVAEAYRPDIPEFITLTVNLSVNVGAFESDDDGSTLLAYLEDTLDRSNLIDGLGAFVVGAKAITEEEYRDNRPGNRHGFLSQD